MRRGSPAAVEILYSTRLYEILLYYIILHVTARYYTIYYTIYYAILYYTIKKPIKTMFFATRIPKNL